MPSEPTAPPDTSTVPGPGRGPVRLHPWSPVFHIGRDLRQLWPLAVLAVAQRWARLPLAAVVLWTVVGSVLRWRNHTWALEEDALRVEEGILGRKRRVLPFDRIQQVTLVRKALHRLLGVATLRVETASGGGGAPEVDLRVLSLGEAQALRATLLRVRAEARATAGDGEPAAPPPERVLIRLSLGQVMLAGVTGIRSAAILAVLGSLSQVADDLPGSWIERIDPRALAPETGAQVAAAALLAVVAWLGLAAASSVLTDYGFTLVRAGGDLVTRRGLLQRSELSMPLARVQVVRVDASPVRRMLGMVAVRVHSAGRAGNDEASRLVVPILPGAAVDRLLGELLPRAAPVPPLHPAPPAARRRALVRHLLPALPPAIVVAALLWPQGALALLALPLAALWGEAAYRALGHQRRGPILFTRRGALLRATSILPIAKAQSARLLATPFQRRAGLATLHVDTAGSAPTPRVIDEHTPTGEALLTTVVTAR